MLLGYIQTEANERTDALDVWAEGSAIVKAHIVQFNSHWRARAWLAILLGASQSPDWELEVSAIAQGAPGNGYLEYRSACAAAAAGADAIALSLLRASIGHGFRSIQLMRKEQALFWKGTSGSEAYEEIAEGLQKQVDETKSRYCTILP